MAIQELVELVSRMAEIERRMSGMVRHGTVAAVDPATQRVRLDFGPAHGAEGRFLSPWVPYSQFAGALNVHTPPTVGQQFTAVSPNGDFQQAVAVPLAHSGATPSPSSAGDQNVITYGDVTITLASGLARIVVGGVTFAITGGGVEITGGTVTHNGTNIGDTHTHTDTPGLGAGTTSPPN